MTQLELEHKDPAVQEPPDSAEPAEKPEAPDKSEEQETVTVTLVPVRFRTDRPSVHCDAAGLTVDEGEWVVVPCEQCSEVGQVAGLPIRIDRK